MVTIKQRRFNFFDESLVKDPSEETKNFDKLKGLNIKFSQHGGDGLIVFGTVDGTIVTMTTKDRELNSYQLFDIDMTCLTIFKHIIVAGGHDSSNPQLPVIKMLRIDKMDDPKSILVNQVNSNVVSVSLSETSNSMVIGLSSGEVYLYKSDVLKYKNEKPRLLHEAPHTITALAFKQVNNKSLLVYVATEHSLFTIVLGGKDKDEKRPLSSDNGARAKCWCLTDKAQFVAARKDAVFIYEHDSLGPCYPFEGEKVSVHWFRGKLVIVARDPSIHKSKAIISSSSNVVEMTTVSIYDIENRYVGFSRSFPHLVTVVCEGGSVYVLASKGEQLHRLTEKDTQSKLDILFKKNHYQMAIDLAQSSQYDQEGVIDIIRQYADHLYAKGDFDKAIGQYIKTIGKLEPSYIIRKFLDSQRIVNLTDYLQELHKSKLANEDHTTLLLNCYTKLKDEARLNAFLHQANIEFDIDTGIKVLRQSGYYKQALQLCEQHAKHEDYLKIQLEHLHDFSTALAYIERLDEASAVGNLKKYGKLMMANIPDKTVDFLKKLCSKFDSSKEKFVADPTEFIQIFLKDPSYLIDFLEYIYKNQISNSKIIANTLLELYIKSIRMNSEKSSSSSALINDAMNDTSEVSSSSSTFPLSLQEKRALEFLSNSTSYDINLALVICQLHMFKTGMLYLYEKNGMYQRILQYHMENNDYLGLLDTCKRYGTQDTNLWVQSLQYFSKREEYNCKDYIMQILANIEKYNLLTPLMVVKILSQNSTLTIDTVKEYLLKRMKKEEAEIEENQGVVNRHLKSIMELKSQIDHLKTEPIIFQANKCEYCGEELNFPSIHCLCKHSFHSECFENHSVDDACPTCAVDNSNFMNLIKQNEESKKNLHDTFHKQLERSVNKFDVIAEYLGKGIFNKVTLVTDN